MLDTYEFPKFFFVGAAAVLAFITMEIMEGWIIAEIPGFIEVVVIFLIIVSALSMVRYILSYVMSGM